MEKPHLGPLDPVADKAAFLLGGKLAPLEFAGAGAAHGVFFQLLKVALEDQGQAQPIFLAAHLGEVMGAEAQAVGFDPHVRLHHSGSHNVLHAALLQQPHHGADGTAFLFLQQFGDRDGKDTFLHQNSSLKHTFILIETATLFG